MTKQEEIENVICDVISHWNQTFVSANCLPLYGGITMSQDIMLGLHSQGVVIKVERELPKIPSFGYVKEEYRWYLRRGAVTYSKMLGGYAAVKPLIEEK